MKTLTNEMDRGQGWEVRAEAAQRAYAAALRARQRDALCLTPERCALRYGFYRKHCHKCQAERARRRQPR
jgi:hypothetical protein